MLERMRPAPSLCRSMTAAAVSSQVVSIPSTSIGLSLVKVRPCIGLEFVTHRVTFQGYQRAIVTWPFSSPDPHPDSETTAAALRAQGL